MDAVRKYRAAIVLAAVVLITGIAFLSTGNAADRIDEVGSVDLSKNETVGVSNELKRSNLQVDFSQATIPLDLVLHGGPPKDGIPALTDPGFTQLSDAQDIPDSVQVMYVSHNGEEKLYPYNILVRHEIVNDTVGGKPLAVTFCPLCGSAIVFEREIDGQVIDFGVSGFLYESNLLMYSREDSESLWSQSRGEAVVGVRTGTKLVHHPTQVLTFAEAKEKFPNATIMDTNTGLGTNYRGTPYDGYEDTERTYYDVSVSDKRFPAKEVFYIVPLEGSSIAVRQDKEDGTYTVPDTDITVTLDNGLIEASWGTAVLPGYFEMWFSWAVHNQDTGIVLD